MTDDDGKPDWEALRGVFVSQEQFGDYKKSMAEVIAEMRSNWRSLKWLIGLIATGVGVELILSLLKLTR